MSDVDQMQVIELDKFTPFKANFPALRAPRWHDNTFIIQANVGAHNKLNCIYTRPGGSRMFPDPLYISGPDARKYKPYMITTKYGQRLKVRAVPVMAFKRLKYKERSIYA